jgi:hypothetical protein
MPRLASLLVVSLLVVGCASRAGSSPGESVTATATSPAASPTETPQSPAPSATSGTCAGPEPLTVSAYLAADPACFGSHDVQIEGWEDIADGVGGAGPNFDPHWLGDLSPPGSVMASSLFDQPCESPCEMRFFFVYVNPATNLRFEADGQWVIITGHRNDPAAETCTYDGSGGPISLTAEEIRQWCRDRFVLTSVRAATPPASALPTCPTASPMRVTEYMNADPVCFGSQEVSVIGWQDLPPILGSEEPSITPTWLWFFSKSVLWQKPPGFDQSGGGQSCTVDDCHFFFVQIRPDSGLTFNPTGGRWVALTGHRQDPASETCKWVYPADWGTSTRLPDLLARQHCRGTFVLTSVSAAAAPAKP